VNPPCPLCFSSSVSLAHQEGPRPYFACAQCDLRFLHPSARLPPEQEKAQYLLHNNDVSDPRYREFVRPLYEQVREHVRPGAKGLDFGSGTGPVLAGMLRRAGYEVRLFDPFFEPDAETLGGTYDFIVACEVMEHVFNPSAELRRLRRMLCSGGLLGVMTLLWDERIDFASWHYRRDPTHVAFYSRATFLWIERFYGFSKVWFPSNRIALLRA
jgi:SAM-dependent methyltransferase